MVVGFVAVGSEEPGVDGFVVGPEVTWPDVCLPVVAGVDGSDVCCSEVGWPDVGFAVEVGSSEIGAVGSGCVVTQPDVCSEEPGVDGFVVGSGVSWPDVGFAVEVGSGCVVTQPDVGVAEVGLSEVGVVAPVVGSAVAVGSDVVVSGAVESLDPSTWISMVSVMTLASLVMISTFALPEAFGVPVILLFSPS